MLHQRTDLKCAMTQTRSTLRTMATLVLTLMASHAIASPPTPVTVSGDEPRVIGHVLSHQKISQFFGGFTGTFNDADFVGFSITAVGDIDGDGTRDLAVGAPQDDDGGFDLGAVWIIFLMPDGTVKSYQKISEIEGGFTGDLDDADIFGSALAAVGDLNNDGTPDLAVGAARDDDGGTDRGAVWILFLHPNGTVKSHQKISTTSGGFAGAVTDGDWFGLGMKSIGDLNRDGSTDLAVGAWQDSDDGTSRGAVWILFLSPSGTVIAHQKISDSEGGFTGGLSDFDQFGYDIAPLGDLNRDGTLDIAVGSRRDSGAGSARGAIWILFLNPDGTVLREQKINDLEGGFTGTLVDSSQFGIGLSRVGDYDCDGVRELAVGELSDDGGNDRGAVWILFLNRDGTVKLHTKISDTSGNFPGSLSDSDEFGRGLAAVGDLNGDGFIDLAVTANKDDDGGTDVGAIWNLFLDGQQCTDERIFDDGFESGDSQRW